MHDGPVSLWADQARFPKSTQEVGQRQPARVSLPWSSCRETANRSKTELSDSRLSRTRASPHGGHSVSPAPLCVEAGGCWVHDPHLQHRCFSFCWECRSRFPPPPSAVWGSCSLTAVLHLCLYFSIPLLLNLFPKHKCTTSVYDVNAIAAASGFNLEKGKSKYRCCLIRSTWSWGFIVWCWVVLESIQGNVSVEKRAFVCAADTSPIMYSCRNRHVFLFSYFIQRIPATP